MFITPVFQTMAFQQNQFHRAVFWEMFIAEAFTMLELGELAWVAEGFTQYPIEKVEG